MQIDNFPSKYGRSPSISGAVPGTNPWTPAKRLVANVLTLHFLNQPLLTGHLNQLTHHESHTGGRDMTSVLMKLLIRRQGCHKINWSTVAKKISFPKQPPLIIAAYTPVKQWKLSLEENAAPVLSRIWVLQAVPALALVRLPEVKASESSDAYEGSTNHEPLMHHGNRLVDGKSHATGKGPERFRGDPINENAWWEILFDLGLLHRRVDPQHFDKNCLLPSVLHNDIRRRTFAHIAGARHDDH